MHRLIDADQSGNPSTSLDVYPTLDEMEEHIPKVLFVAAKEALDLPAVQDLDI